MPRFQHPVEGPFLPLARNRGGTSGAWVKSWGSRAKRGIQTQPLWPEAGRQLQPRQPQLVMQGASRRMKAVTCLSALTGNRSGG